AEHIENFALEPISRWPNLGQACGALTFRDGNFQAQARVMRERIKNGNQIEGLFTARPIHRSEVFEQIELLFIARIAGDVGELQGINDEVRLSAVLKGIEDSGTKALAVTRAQIITQRNRELRRGFRRRWSGP